jgi:hypothetical protein
MRVEIDTILIRAVASRLAGIAAPPDDEVRFHNGKPRGWRNQGSRNFFDTNGFATIVAVKVGMMILVIAVAAVIVLAEGVFLFIGAIHGLVDQTLFFKGAQGAVQGNPIYFSQLLLQVVLRQSLGMHQKQVQHFHPHIGEAQLMRF